jgi:3-deoxy-D-manno-octulosonate 8-phosphate phosphatase (KDO 8-P phosphatase)
MRAMMTNRLSPDLEERIREVRLLLLDVDGVLTEGGLYYANSGDELKRFDVKDGAGLWIASKNGLEVGLLTGKTSALVEKRAQEFGMKRVRQGAVEKSAALEELLADGVHPLKAVAYMGDDVLDLPVIRRVGFSACPADAHDEVKGRVHYVCSKPGGHGAVREVVDLILSVQGRLDAIVQRYWED